MMMSHLKHLTERPDFRRSPLTAIGKRLLWHWRWSIRSDDWRLRLDDGSQIFAHHGGAGALIFFQKSNEPETTSFLNAFLRPGMVFVDVGAHIGEFTLRAARIVGSSGEVHAFEPSPENFDLLKRNIELNDLTNVRPVFVALSDSPGTVPFRVEKEPSLNRLQVISDPDQAPHGIISVNTCRLDSYWGTQPRPIDLIKLDVEGAELLVLSGTEHLSSTPVWIFEYCPSNYSIFGYTPKQLLAAFQDRGYDIWTWDDFHCRLIGELSERQNTNLLAAPKGRHPLEGSPRAHRTRTTVIGPKPKRARGSIEPAPSAIEPAAFDGMDLPAFADTPNTPLAISSDAESRWTGGPATAQVRVIGQPDSGATLRKTGASARR
jgi:FkbM family methyltransferase